MTEGESSKRTRSASPSATGVGSASNGSQPASKKHAVESDTAGPDFETSVKLEVDEEGIFNIPEASTTDTAVLAEAEEASANGEASNHDGKKPRIDRYQAENRKAKARKGKERPPWNPVAGDRRQRFGEDRSQKVEEVGDDDAEEDAEGKKRLPKKRVAVLLGIPRDANLKSRSQTHGAKTIEGDFFAALVKAGAISSENATDHRKVDVQRSARTDAGVHAAGNVISLKMIYDPPLPEGVTTLTEHVNSFLPDQIRMWGFVRTIKSFQARLACDSRVYEYLLPSYCLLPPASTDPISQRLDESSPGWRDALGPGAAFADETPELKESEDGNQLDPTQRREFERRRDWRVDEGTMERFRTLVQEFQGTHNFHNYTVGKPFTDKTVKRYMISLEVRDPKVYGEIEWISVRIHGQSFMLHQIRKMMSLAMLACRTNSPPSLIPATFGPNRIHIPKAPPLGLLLQQPQFKTYNERIQNKVGGSQEDRDPVDFGAFEETMETFKVKWIYERLRQDELETNVFHKWIRQVDCSSSAGFSFLNTQGIIPPEATLSSGKGSGGDQTRGDIGEEGSDDDDVDAVALKRGELEG